MLARHANLTTFVLDDLDYPVSHSMLSWGASRPEARRDMSVIWREWPKSPIMVEAAVTAGLSRWSGRTAVTLRG